MINQLSKSNGNAFPSTSTNSICAQKQIEYSSELDSLTSLLVHFCLTNSDVCEQQSIASFILSKFNNNEMDLSTAFNFIESSPVLISLPTFNNQSKSELIERKENKIKKINNTSKLSLSTKILEKSNEEKSKKIIKYGSLLKQKIDEKNIEIRKNKIYKEEKQNHKKLKSFSERSKNLKTSKTFKNEELFSNSLQQRPSSKRKIKQKLIQKSKSNLDLFQSTINKSKLRRPNTSSGGGNNTNKKLKSPICQFYNNKQQTSSGINKKANKSQLLLIEYILKAIELTNDSLSLLVFCKILNGYIENCERSVKHHHLKFLVKFDIINHLLRAIRTRFYLFKIQNWEILDYFILDILAKTVLLFYGKDKKFALKVRLSGVLSLLIDHLLLCENVEEIFSKQNIFSSQNFNLFCLLAQSLNSVRNAQILSSEQNFIKNFLYTLNSFNSYLSNSIETSLLYKKDNYLLFNEEGNNNNFEFIDLISLKMAKMMECLIILSKNQNIKLQLIKYNCLQILKLIFETNFANRFVNFGCKQIVFISLNILRQFIRIEECRKQLLEELNILKMCEIFIEDLSENIKIKENNNYNDDDDIQLNDSLCSLCLKCLPSQEFFYCFDDFPLKFVLPFDKNNLLITESNNKKEELISSSSSSSYDIEHLKIITNNNNFIEESDEDSSNIWPFNSLNNNKEEKEDLINEEKNDKKIKKTKLIKKDVNNLLLNLSDISQYSRLNLNKIINYQKYFPEFNNDKIKKLIFDEINNNNNNKEDLKEEYDKIILNKWKKINSVGSFVKIANPELYNCSDKILINEEDKQQKYFKNSSNNSMRELITENISNYYNNKKEEKKEENNFNKFFPRVIFDLNNNNKINNNNNNIDYLKFESRFESGNLWKAIQIGLYKYQLIISPDINQQNMHFQWFYFEISNIRSGIQYNFEIINCLKNISMFSKGMQPVLFSTIEAEKFGRIGWMRAGTEINYFRNLYKIPNINMDLIKENTFLNNKKMKRSSLKNKNINQNNCDNIETRNFSSLNFTINFPHDGDICYIAYHFPYTYTRLECTIERWISSSLSINNLFFWRQKLCNTLSGNSVPILTITNNNNFLKLKKIILITSRVHPGESNSSWIIHGFIQFLLSTHPLANRARDIFIFKLIPMLNPDGVINGSHRCSLAGQDLNRVWNCPSSILHPSIFHTKALIQYMVEILKMPPFTFIDLHGHSRKANIFMYGNNPKESWCLEDNSVESKTFSLLPEILSKFSDSFSLKDCSFSITKAKEFSARVSMWRQFKLERVYTCESSYWGFDFGSKIGTQITIADLKRMGTELVEGLVHLYDLHNTTNEANKNINCNLRQ